MFEPVVPNRPEGFEGYQGLKGTKEAVFAPLSLYIFSLPRRKPLKLPNFDLAGGPHGPVAQRSGWSPELVVE